MPNPIAPINAVSDTPAGRPTYPPIHQLDLRTRQIIEETALEEIELFRAWGDPTAIERLAEAGRIQNWCTEEGIALAWQVSDVLDDIAAGLRTGREQAREVLPGLAPQVGFSALRWR